MPEKVERFRYGQRVRVSDRAHYLYDRAGTVTRVREVDGAGVVHFDRPLPEATQLILEGVRYERDTILFPHHCELVRR
jgi:hypothetical protein